MVYVRHEGKRSGRAAYQFSKHWIGSKIKNGIIHQIKRPSIDGFSSQNLRYCFLNSIHQ